MVFSHRFRERVSSRTQQTSGPAATAAAVKTMMRCVVVCGLLLGGLQFSTAPSISFCVAVTLSGKSITAQHSATGIPERTPEEAEFEDIPLTDIPEHITEFDFEHMLPDLEPHAEKCFDDFLKRPYEGKAVQYISGVKFPLPRWNWLVDEIVVGVNNIQKFSGMAIHQALATETCTLEGLEIAILERFENALATEGKKLDKPHKKLINLLIKAMFNYRPESLEKKTGLGRVKFNLINIFSRCKKDSQLWTYLTRFEMWKDEREDICRRIMNAVASSVGPSSS